MSNGTAVEGARTPGMIEVARLAGVSPQTVSRVLSDHPNVRAETRAKVLAAVEALDYRRNSAARALSSGRTRTIGLIQLQTATYSRVAFTVGVEQAASAAGYAVNGMTATSLEAPAVEDAIARSIDQGVDGLILSLPLRESTPRIDRIARSIPCIAIDGLRGAAAGVIAVDQVELGRIATQHLLDLGHQTVWHIAGPTSWSDADTRTAGWRTTLEAAGRSVPPMLRGDWSPESGYQNGLILGRIPEATAVFVASDEMAFGVLRALAELGRSVPGEISVVGADDIQLAAYSTPPLSTVAQPFSALGARAVEQLIGRIDGGLGASSSVLVAPTFVTRASTGPSAR